MQTQLMTNSNASQTRFFDLFDINMLNVENLMFWSC